MNNLNPFNLSFVVILVFMSAASCSKVSELSVNRKSSSLESFHKHSIENVIARWGRGEELISFDLGIYTKKKLNEDSLKEKEEIIKEITLNHLGQLKSLNRKEDVQELNKDLANSYNRYLAEIKIVKVKLEGLKKL